MSDSDASRVSWIGGAGALIAGACARRPLRTLLVAAVVLVAAIVSIVRTPIDASLGAMLGDDAASAAALARVGHAYHTLDELLVSVSLPESYEGADVAPLAEFAERFAAALRASPGAPQRVQRIAWTRDAALERYVREVMLPRGAYYLSEDGFTELLRRVTPEGMREQIARNEALAAAPGPAAAAIGDRLLRDPLRLTDLIDEDVYGIEDASPAAAGSATEAGPALELSSDRRSLLIRVSGRRPVNDLAFAQALADDAAAAAETANIDGLTLEIGGGYAIAATTSRAIRGDSIRSSIAAVVLLHVLFFIFYRRIAAPVLVGLTAGVGVVAGFGVHAAFATGITPLTAVIAAMLAGLGVDYGVHFLSHYQAARADASKVASAASASSATARALARPIVTNCLTSVFGFVALLTAQVAMLRDFAVMGALGLVGAAAAVFTVLPALLAVSDRFHAPVSGGGGGGGSGRGGGGGAAARTIVRRGSVLMRASSVVFGVAVVALVVFGLPGLESDLTIMHPRPNAPLAATERIAGRFVSIGESVPIEVRGRDDGELIARAHAVAAALQASELQAAGLNGVLGVHLLVPRPADVDARAEALGRIDPERVLADFDDALEASVFDPAAFTEYRTFLGELITPKAAPTLADVRSYPSIAERVLDAEDAGVTSETGVPREDARLGEMEDEVATLLIARFDRPIRDRAERDRIIELLRAAVDTVPGSGATVTGMPAVSYDLERSTRADLPRAIGLSVGLILVWLVVALRRVSSVLLAMTPLLFGAVCTLAAMRLLGIQFNPVNAVALPLLCGIAVDAGVFLVSAAARKRDGAEFEVVLAPLVHAVIVAGVTTVAGFGALAFTSTPAICTLGVVVAIGVAASLGAALCFLAPVLARRRKERSS